MFGFGENKSRTFLQNGDPVGSINSASLHLRGKSMGYSEKVLDKKKKFLVFLFVFSVVGGVLTTSHFFDQGTNTAFAGSCNTVEPSDDCPDSEPFEGGKGGGWTINPIKWVLYGIWWVLSLLLNAAVALYIFIIHPTNFEQLLNLKSVYEMWKFIRDFFNLFFILVLLYIAFTVVFQIQKDFKKALLSLVLAALFINFSFPVTRFLIDATNVPMYFFINQTNAITQHGDGGMSAILSASQLKGILLPDGRASDIGDFLLAIIFTFLLAIAVLVLAVMMVVRLIALTILVVFSSVGFAASIVPGMEKYSKMWWENFWKYALFGPAAGLMLLISVRFMTEAKGGAILQGAKDSAIQVAAAKDESNLIVSLSLAAIPLILLWFTIGLAQTFSIAGAASVTGYGKKFAKWAGKKTMDGGKWLTYKNPVARGVGGGVKDRFDNNRLVKFLRSPSKTEARIKGAVGTGTMKGELEKLHDKAAYEKAKKMKEDNVGNSELEKSLGSSNRKADGSFKDLVAARAAAMVLSERKAISSANDFSAALQALGNNTKEVSALINGAGRPAFATMDGAMYRNIVNSNVISSNPNIAKAFDAQLKKEGKADAIVDYRVSINGEPQGAVIRDVFDNMTADVIAKQEDLFKHVRYGSDAKIDIGSLMGTDPQLYQEVKRKASKKVSALIP